MSIDGPSPAGWSEDIPGYASILACRCFAQEEAGNYLAAEPSGRRAMELDPADLWAAHAVAHVMESQGRRSEGIEWLATLAPNWEGSHNLQHHLWWHCALFSMRSARPSVTGGQRSPIGALRRLRPRLWTAAIGV